MHQHRQDILSHELHNRQSSTLVQCLSVQSLNDYINPDRTSSTLRREQQQRQQSSYEQRISSTSKNNPYPRDLGYQFHESPSPFSAQADLKQSQAKHQKQLSQPAFRKQDIPRSHQPNTRNQAVKSFKSQQFNENYAEPHEERPRQPLSLTNAASAKSVGYQ